MTAALIVLLALATGQGQEPAARPDEQALAGSGYVPQRVYDTRDRRFVDFETMVADLKGADAVLVGEQHDDPNTHRLEAALLEGLARRRVAAVLSLEMFERDVQPILDDYLAGRVDEPAFLAGSRPWPRYTTDYRPLLELARHARWPVVAANVPRRLAAAVARDGTAALDALDAGERTLAAHDLACARDAYYDRFLESMTDHRTSGGSGKGMDEAALGRYFESQCLKDETMAEAIVRAAVAAAGPVVHVTGAFHSEFDQGTTSRVRRRMPAARVEAVSIVPVEDLDALAPEAGDHRRARYLVYTVGKPE